MKVLVFGATGGTGRQVVDLALEQGHEVTAFARDPAKVPSAHARLRVVRGDVLDAAAVSSAVSGHDAVICALGTPATTRNTVRSKGTRNILDAMAADGARRLVCLSSIGIGDSRVLLPFRYRYVLVPLLLRQGFAEHELQEQHVRGSGVDWTIVRPGELTNGPRTGAYRHGLTGSANGIRAKISRADVADFLLRQLEDRAYRREAPWVSY